VECLPRSGNFLQIPYIYIARRLQTLKALTEDEALAPMIWTLAASTPCRKIGDWYESRDRFREIKYYYAAATR
jgi:hypothetical protein